MIMRQILALFLSYLIVLMPVQSSYAQETVTVNKEKVDSFSLAAGNSAVAGTAAAAIVAGLSAMVLFGLGGCNSQPSVLLMKAAAITHLINEVASYVYYRLETEKLNEKYSSLVDGQAIGDANAENVKAYEAQGIAFEYMIAREDLFTKTMKTKKDIYNATATAYYLAAFISAIELILHLPKPFQQKDGSCSPNDNNSSSKVASLAGKALKMAAGAVLLKALFSWGGMFVTVQENIKNTKDPLKKYFAFIEYQGMFKGQLSSPSIDDYERAEGMLQLEAQESKIFNDTIDFIIAAGRNIKNQFTISSAHADPVSSGTKSIKNFMGNPVGRIIISGIMGTAVLALSVAASKEIEKSEARKDHLMGILTDMSPDIDANLSTICTTPECMNIDTNLPSGTPPPGTQAYNSENFPPLEAPNFCMNANQEVDTYCACKKKNSCLNLTPKFNLPGINMNSPEITSVTDDLNKITGGRHANGNLGSSGKTANAFRDKAMKKIKDNGLEKMVEDERKKIFPVINKAVASVSDQYGAQDSGISPPGFDGINAKLSDELKKKINKNLKAQDKDLFMSAAPPIKNSSKKDVEDFEFDDDEFSFSGDAQIATAQKTKYKYGDVDVNKDTYQNIFEIISQRYRKTESRLYMDRIEDK